MRRILPAALATALLAGSFAGAASARLANDGAPARQLAPMVAPAALPAEDAAHPGSYGFRTSAAIARRYERPAVGAQPSGGASATVTVTATVLPVVFIIVDGSGDVTELFTNSPDRNARGVLFLIRRDSTSGPAVELDAETWAAARTALRSAGAGTGTIWSA